MAFVFHRQLAIPLWAMAFFAVALSTATATPFLMAVFGVAVIAFTIARLVPSSRSVVHVVSDRQPDKRSAAISMSRGTCVRTLEEANVNIAEDAIDLVRMDDDGGWQMARPRPDGAPPTGIIH